MVLYWYQSQGRVVASEYWSKIYMVLDAVKTSLFPLLDEYMPS